MERKKGKIEISNQIIKIETYAFLLLYTAPMETGIIASKKIKTLQNYFSITVDGFMIEAQFKLAYVNLLSPNILTLKIVVY